MGKLQVFHIEKRHSISSGLNRHITRKHWMNGKLVDWVPANADPERTKENVELVSREFANSHVSNSLQSVVNRRIADAGVKPRKTSVTSLEMIFSGSSEVMCNMSREEVLAWAQDTLEWAQKTWGKENVVSASLHLDEKTPHIHMIVVPIVKGQSRRTKFEQEKRKKKKSYKINFDKPRLCANEVYTEEMLYSYHDNYAAEVSIKYGLERGLRAERGSKKKHQTSEDYNRQLAAQALEQKQLLEFLTADYAQKETRLKKQEDTIKHNTRVIDKQVSDYNARKVELQELQESVDEKQQFLQEFRDVEHKVQEKKSDLAALASAGLMNVVASIPEMMKKDVQARVKGYWKGEVQSFELVKYTYGDSAKKEDFVKVNMSYDSDYFIEVHLGSGAVYYNGENKPHTWKSNGKEASMPELAAYFRTEVTPEAIALVESLYKNPQNNDIEVVWECNLYERTRIIRNPDGGYKLQQLEWDTHSAVDGKYTRKVWHTKTTFEKFKELGRDDTYAFLKIKKGDIIRYINQFGSALTGQQIKKLGIQLNQVKH